jgi:5-hydroxyisourate hydrolase-like protein (transthyretin family)
VAESPGCQITVHVLDPGAGHGVGGAAVEVRTAAGRSVAHATTDPAGRVAPLGGPDLPPGEYEIRVRRADGPRRGDWSISGVGLWVRLDAPGEYHVPVVLGDGSLVAYRGVR